MRCHNLAANPVFVPSHHPHSFRSSDRYCTAPATWAIPALCRAVQVGDGAGELQDAVVGAGAQVELGNGLAQQVSHAIVHLAVLPNPFRLRVGVAVQFRACKSFRLDLARAGRSLPDAGEGVAGRGGRKVLVAEPGLPRREVGLRSDGIRYLCLPGGRRPGV